MVPKRSLIASTAGIKQARKAFLQKGWTQDSLSNKLNIKTRQPIWKFFSGQPIERRIFIEICQLLELDWQTITSQISVSEIVKNIRKLRQNRVNTQCEYYYFWSSSIYINPNISLKTIEQNHKSVILGSSGSGKTMFLQDLVLLCNQGSFLPDFIPIYIPLRNIRFEQNFKILKYIEREFLSLNIKQENIKTLCKSGAFFLLFDDLDQLSEEIILEISIFSQQYPANILVVSSKKQYFLVDFTTVQIDPLSWEKVTSSHLNFDINKNKYLKNLFNIPIFFNLLCCLSEQNIKLPETKTEFYQQCLDILLFKLENNKSFCLAQKLEIFSQILSAIYEQEQTQEILKDKIETIYQELILTNLELQLLNKQFFQETL
jgi:predicted NACHT family NTPase